MKSAGLFFRAEATPCRDQFIVMLFMKYKESVGTAEVVYGLNRIERVFVLERLR